MGVGGRGEDGSQTWIVDYPVLILGVGTSENTTFLFDLFVVTARFMRKYQRAVPTSTGRLECARSVTPQGLHLPGCSELNSNSKNDYGYESIPLFTHTPEVYKDADFSHRELTHTAQGRTALGTQRIRTSPHRSSVGGICASLVLYARLQPPSPRPL
eukprot:766822-Hanusia_phi.AAC.2